MTNLEKLKEQARKFEQKEQWAKAIEPLVKAVEEFEKAPENESDLALYNRVGDLYVKVNDSTNAIQYYERAVDRYYDAGLVNNAIALCNKLLRLSPGRAGTYLKLGMLFAKKGFMGEAKQNLLEFADRMQKAGQLEEAFKALKKFAEMTPGQDEIWTVLAQQARAQAKTPEQKEEVDKLLSEFEAKEKVVQQRRSRMSRSMVTGEVIEEEAGPKKGELIFLDLDEAPAPAATKVAPAPREAPPPVEVAPLEIESTSLAEPEPAALPSEPPMLEVEPTSMVEAEPSPGAGLGLEPTSLGIEPTSLGIEPTSLVEEPAAAEPVIEPAPAEAEAAAAEPELGELELGEIEIEPAAEAPAGREAAELVIEEPVAEVPSGLPLLEVEEVEAPAPGPEVEAEVGAATDASLEFLDLGAVEEPTAPTASDLEARIAAKPDDWEAHRLLGEALLAEGERERGMAELDASLDGYDQAGDVESATSVVEEILRLDTNSVRHQQKRVELAYRSGDRARLVEAYVELADALLRSDDAEKALAVYQRVLEHDPGNARAKSAVETLTPAAPPTPEPARVSVPAPAAAGGEGEYVDLGSFLLDEEAPKDTRMRVEDEEPTGDEQKDFQQMLSAFKKGIEANVDEGDFQSHYDLGVAYKEMGLLDEAIAEFQKALRAPDGRLRSSEALGMCFFEKGQHTVAETILRRGLELPAAGDSERLGILYWLGRTLEHQGRVPQALEAYSRVFAVDINFQDVNDRVSALSRAGV